MNKYELYLNLSKQVKELKEKLDDVKGQMAEVEGALLDQFQEDGMNSVKIGGATLWLDHKIWASAGGDTPGAVEALKRAGFHDMVTETINRNTLSKFVREHARPLETPEEIQKNLPGGLGEAIRVTETHNIRVRGL